MATEQAHPLGVTATSGAAVGPAGDQRDARCRAARRADGPGRRRRADLDRGGRFPPGDGQGGARAWSAGRADRAPGLREGRPGRAGQPELTQRHHPQDAGHRGRRGRAGHPAGPGGQLRAAAGAQGRPPRRRPGRDDHLAVRGWDDGARHPAPPGPHAGHRAVPRDDLQRSPTRCSRRSRPGRPGRWRSSTRSSTWTRWW